MAKKLIIKRAPNSEGGGLVKKSDKTKKEENIPPYAKAFLQMVKAINPPVKEQTEFDVKVVTDRNLQLENFSTKHGTLQNISRSKFRNDN